jgi:hypothetical protein
MHLVFSESGGKSPLLYSPTEFVDKLVERGGEFDFDLRNQIMTSLNSLGQFSSNDDRMRAHYNYWNGSFHNDSEEKQYLARLGRVFCVFEKYNIPYVNYLVIFYYFTQYEIKNLYRNYYIEWSQLEKDLEQPTILRKQDIWRHTPRDFNRLPEKELQTSWISFLTHVIADTNSICYILFVLNKLYQYVTPYS